MKYQHKILVLPDVHTHYEKAERICRKYPDHKIVAIGDYFDDFKATPDDNGFTADWLVTSLGKDNRIHLYGNHDLCYHPQVNLFCSGYSTANKTSINNVMKIEHWDKLKFFHYENGWYFSHAGISSHWFGNPVSDKITPERIQNIVDHAFVKHKTDDPDNALWAADRFRGGRHTKGGLLWNDWRNMDLIMGMKQVVGHTPIPKIVAITDNVNNCSIINVDNSAITYMSEVLEIDENGNPNILDTSHV